MMVDNSIVVLESCFRSHKGQGFREYMEAALEGTGKVIQSIFGGTVTTCVVFIPLALLKGMSGQMFAPLGFTIVFCMAAVSDFRYDDRTSVLQPVPAGREEKFSGFRSGAHDAERLSKDHRKAFKQKKNSYGRIHPAPGVILPDCGKTWICPMPDVDQGTIAVTVEVRLDCRLKKSIRL